LLLDLSSWGFGNCCVVTPPLGEIERSV